MSSDTSDLCTSFRCRAIPGSVAGEVVSCAIPLLIATVVSARFLQQARWQFNRLRDVVSSLDWPILRSTPFAYSQYSAPITAALQLTAALPVPALIFLCVMSYYLLKPYYASDSYPESVAVALATGGIQLLVGGYGFFHWRARRYRWSNVPESCFIFCILAMMAFQLSLTYVVLDDEYSSYIVLILYNLLPLVFAIYGSHFIAPPLSFYQFMQIRPGDVAFEEVCERHRRHMYRWMIGAVILSVIILWLFGVTIQSRYDSNWGYQVAAGIMYCDFALILHHWCGLVSHPLLLIGLLIISRILFFALWQPLWFISVSVQYILFTILLLHYTISSRWPVYTKEEALDAAVGSLELTLKRTMQTNSQKNLQTAENNTTSSPQPYHLMQNAIPSFMSSTLTPMTSTTSSTNVTDINNINKINNNIGLTDRFTGTVDNVIIWGGRVRSNTFISSPVFAIIILTSLYLSYVIVSLIVALVNPSWKETVFPSIQAVQQYHNQYEYGFFCLLVVSIYAIALITYQINAQNNSQFSWKTLFMFLFFIITSIVSFYLLSLVTGSFYIFVFSIWGPFLAATAAYTYSEWRAQDYQWNSWQTRHRKQYEQIVLQQRQNAQNENTDSAAPTTTVATSTTTADNTNTSSATTTAAETTPLPPRRPDEGFWIFQAAIDFFLGRHTFRDYELIILVLFCAGICVAIGLHLAYNITSALAYLIAEIVGLMILILFILLKWINTFHIGILNSVAVLIITGHASYQLYELVDNNSLIIALSFALLLPASITFLMALYSWHSNQWLVSHRETRVMYVTLLCVAAFIFAFVIIQQALFAGLITLIVFSFLSGLIFLSIVWSQHDFTLPKVYLTVAISIYCAVMFAALALFIYLSVYWLWILCLIFVSLLIPLGTFVIKDLSVSRDHRLTSSAALFPIYVYSPSLSSADITINNRGVLSLYAIAALLVIFGILCALLISPHWAGWIVFAIGLLIAATVTLHFVMTPSSEFWLCWQQLSDNPEVIDEIRTMAIASQLKRDDDGSVEMTCENDDYNQLNEDFTNNTVAIRLLANGDQVIRRQYSYSNKAESIMSPGRSSRLHHRRDTDPPSSPTKRQHSSGTPSSSQPLSRTTSGSGVSNLPPPNFSSIAPVGKSVVVDAPSRSSSAVEKDLSSSTSTAMTDADPYLTHLRRFWSWEARYSVAALLSQQSALRSCPQALPDLSDADPLQQAQIIKAKQMEIDDFINAAHTEEGRMLVSFQLLCAVTADALKRKNRGRIRDFVRAYDKAHPDAVQLMQLSSNDFIDWIKVHGESLAQAKEGYLTDTAATMATAAAKADAERKAAALRKKQQRRNDEAAAVTTSALSTHHGALQTNDIALPDSLPITITRTQDNHTRNDELLIRSDDAPLTDEYDYQMLRSAQIDIQSLDIRGATIDEVREKAREQIGLIINKYNLDGRFVDPLFPRVRHLPQLIRVGQAVTDTDEAVINAQTNGTQSLTSSSSSRYVWRRPDNFLDNPTLNIDELNPRQIIQGDLEDCYLLSALSVLTKDITHKTVLQSQFIVDEYSPVGIYGMIFFQDGLWRAVLVDDQFPVKLKADNHHNNTNVAVDEEKISGVGASRDSAEWVFAHSKQDDEIWVAVLEKCYAKLYSGYPSIIGGLVHESLKDLTGGATDELALDNMTTTPSQLSMSSSSSNNTSTLTIWQRLFTYYRQGYLMGCGNPKLQPGRFTVINGIVQGHAYAILEVREAESIRLLKLRNPWGQTQWEGDFGPHSPLWTVKNKRLFHYSTDDALDGVFWMSIDDFVTQFQRVYICRLFENVRDNVSNRILQQAVKPTPTTTTANKSTLALPGVGQPPRSPSLGARRLQAAGQQAAPPSLYDVNALVSGTSLTADNNIQWWYSQQVHDAWRAESAAGCPKFVTSSSPNSPELNPHYSFALLSDKPALVFMTLTQPTRNESDNKLREYVYMGIFIINNNNRRVRAIKKHQTLASTLFKNVRELAVEFEANSAIIYTIFLSTFKPHEESLFTLNVYSRQRFELLKMNNSTPIDS